MGYNVFVSLTQQVKAEARRLGFDLVGVTTPDPPAHLDFFETWLEAGCHGEMGYLDTVRSRLRRANPREILPECQSILVLGTRYPKPETVFGEAPSGLIGKIAAYAWGDDYHQVIPKRLSSLADFIEKQVGAPVPHRWYTDTGPVLERELGQRAGLGWIGKNTCLINPAKGSYYLLSEILLGIALAPDHPFLPDHCGSCNRCLEACPTGCILPDRLLDASRCISYLTIELKGTIPNDLRSQMGGWVFGCDVCQRVCPWNQRFAGSAGDRSFAPRQGLLFPLLVQELSLNRETFNRKFKDSPLKRAKRRGYLRNVCVALGNARDPAAVPALVQAIRTDPESLVRGHAAWALGQIGGKDARKALQKALQLEREEEVLVEIHSALNQPQNKTGNLDG
jgi:epoxyqueuosine reductase